MGKGEEKKKPLEPYEKRCGAQYTVVINGRPFVKFCTRKPHLFGAHR